MCNRFNIELSSGSKGGTPVSPSRPKIFSITYSFSKNLAKSYVCPPEVWCSLLRGILDLPLECYTCFTFFSLLQTLSSLLYQAASECGFVNPRKVEEILQVPSVEAPSTSSVNIAVSPSSGGKEIIHMSNLTRLCPFAVADPGFPRGGSACPKFYYVDPPLRIYIVKAKVA